MNNCSEQELQWLTHSSLIPLLWDVAGTPPTLTSSARGKTPYSSTPVPYSTFDISQASLTIEKSAQTQRPIEKIRSVKTSRWFAYSQIIHNMDLCLGCILPAIC